MESVAERAEVSEDTAAGSVREASAEERADRREQPLSVVLYHKEPAAVWEAR